MDKQDVVFAGINPNFYIGCYQNSVTACLKNNGYTN